jgi:hypothetical protein
MTWEISPSRVRGYHKITQREAFRHQGSCVAGFRESCGVFVWHRARPAIASGHPFRESEGTSVSDSCGAGPQSHIHPARATGPAKVAVAAAADSELASSPHP